jgi:type II secretory pathway pseudopilin PulG
MRKGFSLLTAIVFLVLIATISALSISLSTQSVKQTGDVLLKSQAELLLRSATEYAMLAISGAPNGCLSDINATHNGIFDINISIMYIGNGLPAACPQIGTDINTSDSNRTVIIDTWVRTKADIVTEPIVIHRRTIQKP